MELGTFNTPAGATALFLPSTFQAAMQETITHWSIATGRDVKVRPVAVTAPRVGQPTYRFGGREEPAAAADEQQQAAARFALGVTSFLR